MHPEGRARTGLNGFSRGRSPRRHPAGALEAARSAAARLEGKPSERQRAAGTWVTNRTEQRALPFTQFRSSFGYVQTSTGRGPATAIAIDSGLSTGHCRLWVFAAGGGAWRTKNARAPAEMGVPLPDFGIQAGSAITLDPNDPTGDTCMSDG